MIAIDRLAARKVHGDEADFLVECRTETMIHRVCTTAAAVLS